MQFSMTMFTRNTCINKTKIITLKGGGKKLKIYKRMAKNEKTKIIDNIIKINI